MTEMNTNPRPGLIRRLWRTFWSPSGVLSLGLILIGGFAVGIFFWGGFNWALEITNTEKFCISCHEMRDNVFAEYEGTIHQNNSSGVRATCPDCHVPKEWGYKVVRKIKASKELYGHFVSGIVDTPEKFEEHRLDLATRVWTAMKSTDSRECRNCHKLDFMDFTTQEDRASKGHQRALDENMTCIDCHQGIAHNLPEGWMQRYEEVADGLASSGALAGPPVIAVADATGLAAVVDYLAGTSN